MSKRDWEILKYWFKAYIWRIMPRLTPFLLLFLISCKHPNQPDPGPIVKPDSLDVRFRTHCPGNLTRAWMWVYKGANADTVFDRHFSTNPVVNCFDTTVRLKRKTEGYFGHIGHSQALFVEYEGKQLQSLSGDLHFIIE